MNKTKCLLLLLPLIIYQHCGAQKIEVNKIDDFTKHHILSTSWEKLVYATKAPMFAFTKVEKINNDRYLNLRVMMSRGETFAIKPGAELMIKNLSDSIITLHNLKYTISCHGCGSIGIMGSDLSGASLSFYLSEEDFTKLKRSPITKVRLYTSDGYVEDDITEKFAGMFSRQLNLVD